VIRSLNLKRLLPFVVLAALAAGGWHQFVAPKREQAARIAAELDAADAQLAQLQSQLADYGKAREGYPADRASVTRLGKALPADDDMRSLMVQIDTATRRSGVDFSSILISGDSAAAPDTGTNGTAVVKPGATIPGAVVVPGSDISTMPFTFAFHGDFFALSSFIARLQRFVTVRDQAVRVNGRLLRIESINLKPAESGFPQIEAQVKASSFVAPAARSTARGGAAAPTAGATPTGGSGTSGGAAGTSPEPATTPEPPTTTAATASGAVQ
jgi:hypothetical protein